MKNIKDKIIGTIRRIGSGGVNIKKLKKNGLRVGEECWFGNGAFIDPTFCFLIEIGNNCTITSNVHILAHDASTKKILGYTKIGSVKIGDNVFIGANAIILPGINIGNNSVIAAGAVVSKNVPADEVWGGNPAHKICSIEEYKRKHEKPTLFNEELNKERICKLAKDGIVYIK